MDLSEQPVGQTFLRHPWELAKRHFLLHVVRAFRLDAVPACILDAGAGDAWIGMELLHALPEGSSLVSWDIHYGAPSVRADRHRLTPTLGESDTGDLLLALDVLEHIERPLDWLSSLVSRHLAPRGHALVSVPAWPFLYGVHDRALGHHCRFRPATARRLVGAAGLEIICEGGLFLSLLPVRVVGNGVGRWLNPGGAVAPPERLEWRWGRLTRRIVVGALALDCNMALALARRRVTVPGLSWWALCQKI